jgi:hypothetical protein
MSLAGHRKNNDPGAAKKILIPNSDLNHPRAKRSKNAIAGPSNKSPIIDRAGWMKSGT